MICDEIDCGLQMSIYCLCDKSLCNNHQKIHSNHCTMEKVESTHYKNPMAKLREMKLSIISAAERITESVKLNSSDLLKSLNKVSPKTRNIKDLPKLALDSKHEQKAEKYIKACFNKSYSDSLNSSFTITHSDSIAIQPIQVIQQHNLNIDEFNEYKRNKEEAIQIAKKQLDLKQESIKSLIKDLCTEYMSIKLKINQFLTDAKKEIELAMAQKTFWARECEKGLREERDLIRENLNMLEVREKSFQEHMRIEEEKLKKKEEYLENCSRNRVYSGKKIGELGRTLENQTGRGLLSGEDELKKKISEARLMNLERFEDIVENSFLKIQELMVSTERSILFLCICY